MPGENEPSYNGETLDIIHEDSVELKREVIEKKVKEIVKESIFLNPFPNFGGLQVELSKKEDVFINYIVEGNLKSGKNPQLEKYIEDLSSHPLVWKLKMLVDSKDSLEATLRKIDEKEKKIVANNRKSLSELEESSQQDKEQSKFGKWIDAIKNKINGIGSNFVNLSNIPEKIGGVIGDMLARGESYIGQTYICGKMDCSMFLSKVLCVGKGIKEQRLGTSRSFSLSYPKVLLKDVRCGDIMYNEGHVEMVVGTPFEENGVKYIMTIGSSTDTDKNDPMFDAKGNPIKHRNGVGYRKRQVYPNPRHLYTYHRPPYNEWAEKRS